MNLDPKNIKIHIILVVLAGFVSIPIVIMLYASFRNGGIQNYLTPLTHPFFVRGFLNSTIISVPTVIMVIFIASLTGFALSKLNLIGKEIIFPVFLVALMLPVSAIIIQLFLMMIKLNLLNNHLGVILPVVSLTMPFGLLVIKNYMDDIPNDIVEASVIDGCSHLTIYWRIVLPLSLPALSAVTIFSFLNAWNEYLLPLVALRKTELLPVTRLTSFFINQFTRNYHMFFASSVIIILPVVVVYVFLQRYFIRGLTAGALKA